MSAYFDAVVIGGGPGGYTCAAELGRYGLKTALVERDKLGGTCLNRGCIPTKALLHTVELFREARDGERFGLETEGVSVNYPALRARKDAVVETLRDGVEQMLAASKVTVFHGEGYVPAAGKVRVTLPDGGVENLETAHIVAAVGSCPAMPPIEGLDLPGVVTSDGILRDVPELRSLVVIGGGVIGMEFASLYSALGAKVTVLEGLPRILPAMDKELGQSLTQSMKKRGVEIVTNALVSSVARGEEGLTCTYGVKGKPGSTSGEAVLVAVGRRVGLERVFAPEVLPECDRGRAVVDGSMRSAIPGVWVIGDAVAGFPQLAHAAEEQGRAAAAGIAGKPFRTDLTLVPGCVYTSPEIAAVGLTEAEAKERGIAVRCGKVPTTANGKSVLTGQERGFVKVVAGEDGKLLGAQLFCAHATDIIGELTLAISAGLTVEEAASVIRPHPTFEEAVGEALRACCRKA